MKMPKWYMIPKKNTTTLKEFEVIVYTRVDFPSDDSTFSTVCGYRFLFYIFYISSKSHLECVPFIDLTTTVADTVVNGKQLELSPD